MYCAMHQPVHELYFPSFHQRTLNMCMRTLTQVRVGVGCSNEPLLQRLLDPTLTPEPQIYHHECSCLFSPFMVRNVFAYSIYAHLLT